MLPGWAEYWPGRLMQGCATIRQMHSVALWEHGCTHCGTNSVLLLRSNLHFSGGGWHSEAGGLEGPQQEHDPHR